MLVEMRKTEDEIMGSTDFEHVAARQVESRFLFKRGDKGRVMYKVFFVMITLLLINGPVVSQTDELEFFPAGGSGGRVAPFSDAVRVGNLLFVSGKLGVVDGGLAPGGITAETRQALENIKTSLERYGSSMNQVAKCTVFLADMAEWGQMNEVYVTFFGDNPPARSAIGTSGLARGGRVEIECIGVIAD